KTRRERWLGKQRRLLNDTCTNLMGDLQSPSREVPAEIHSCQTNHSDVPQPSIPVFPDNIGEPEVHWSEIWKVDTAAGESDTHPGVEQPLLTTGVNPSILTRKTDPFKSERVDAVLKEITIGTDLTPEQQTALTDLLREHADCFALSMSEVTVVEGAEHKLYIPNRETATFRTKVNQRPLSGPQKEYFNGVLNNMLDAGIIAPISYKDVKCCGATTLAKKAHEGGGLTIEELQYRVNDECVTAGFPNAFPGLPPRETEVSNLELEIPAKPVKWRVCQDFADLNKVTKATSEPNNNASAATDGSAPLILRQDSTHAKSQRRTSPTSASTWKGAATSAIKGCHSA
ncbi:hypothetical protein DXG01_013126, partial [Tephrocybe rancida]